jgi:lysophospholipase L1-like esterase
MKKLAAFAFALFVSAAAVSFAQDKPAATTKPLAPQKPDVAAIKYDAKTGEPNKGFMNKHEQFLERAKQGDVEILFVGDSITQGWNGAGKEVWQKTYADRKAANFGIGGDRTQHVLWRMENGELEGIKPRVAVLMIGTNNTNSDQAPEIASGVEKIVKTIRDKTGAKVLLLGVFPRGADESEPKRAIIKGVNERIAKLDDGSNVRFLDISDKFLQPDKTLTKEIMPDLLHLSPKGYQIWADAMQPLLDEMLK